MMGIAHPRERRRYTDRDRQVCCYTSDQDGIMCILVVDEYENNSED